MEIIKNKLNCKDCEKLIFEFLINDQDYSPFTMKEIKMFSEKILHWDPLMHWAITSNSLSEEDRIKAIIYVSDNCRFEEYDNHEFCYHCGGLDGYHNKYYRKIGSQWVLCWENVYNSAAKYGKVEIIKYLYRQRRESLRLKWEQCEEAIHGHLEVIKYIAKIVGNPLRNYYLDLCAKGAAFGGQVHILEYLDDCKDIDWKECFYLAAKGGKLNTLKFCEESIEKIYWNDCVIDAFTDKIDWSDCNSNVEVYRKKESEILEIIKYRVSRCCPYLCSHCWHGHPVPLPYCSRCRSFPCSWCSIDYERYISYSLDGDFLDIFKYLIKCSDKAIDSYYQCSVNKKLTKIVKYILSQRNNVDWKLLVDSINYDYNSDIWEYIVDERNRRFQI